MTMQRVRYLLWAAVAVAAVATFAASRVGKTQRTEKGAFGKVPAFSLTDQQGRTVTLRELSGTPWVANFIFTRCPSVCPLLTAKFKALQTKVGMMNEDAAFVSFTVDPEHDTPEVLAAYAEKFAADPARWHFLTGPMAAIEKTVVEGFKVHIGSPEPHKEDPSLIDIMHGEHFVLVDRDGIIRGYYRAEPAELDELAEDLHKLASEGTATARLSESPADAQSTLQLVQ